MFMFTTAPLNYINPFKPEGEVVGADGLTNEQWIEASRRGAEPNLAKQYRIDNWRNVGENTRANVGLRDFLLNSVFSGFYTAVDGQIQRIWVNGISKDAYYNRSDYASSGGDAQTLFLLGLGLTADGAEGAANLFQTINAGVKAAAVRNNLPTTQIDKIMGNTSKFATGAKWAGRGVIVVGAGISIYQGYDAYTQGDMTGVSKAGLDLGVGLGATAIGGIPGVLLYG